MMNGSFDGRPSHSEADLANWEQLDVWVSDFIAVADRHFDQELAELLLRGSPTMEEYGLALLHREQHLRQFLEDHLGDLPLRSGQGNALDFEACKTYLVNQQIVTDAKTFMANALQDTRLRRINALRDASQEAFEDPNITRAEAEVMQEDDRIGNDIAGLECRHDVAVTEAIFTREQFRLRDEFVERNSRTPPQQRRALRQQVQRLGTFHGDLRVPDNVHNAYTDYMSVLSLMSAPGPAQESSRR